MVAASGVAALPFPLWRAPRLSCRRPGVRVLAPRPTDLALLTSSKSRSVVQSIITTNKNTRDRLGHFCW